MQITQVWVWWVYAIIEIGFLSVLKTGGSWGGLKSCESWGLEIGEAGSSSVIELKRLFEIVREISIEEDTVGELRVVALIL